MSDANGQTTFKVCDKDRKVRVAFSCVPAIPVLLSTGK